MSFLALRVRAKVGLEAEWVDDGHCVYLNKWKITKNKINIRRHSSLSIYTYYVIPGPACASEDPSRSRMSQWRAGRPIYIYTYTYVYIYIYIYIYIYKHTHTHTHTHTHIHIHTYIYTNMYDFSYLALRVRAKIRLEAERVDDGQYMYNK